MTDPSGLRIGLVYPDLLGTYGDRGNAVVLAQRARWRGVPAEIVEIAPDTAIPDSLDLYLLGGGEDDAQHLAAAGLRDSAAALRRAHGRGAVVLAVCAGFQLLGHRYVTAQGRSIDGIGLLDLETHPGPGRLIGELVVEPGASRHWGGDAPPALTGFENHGGRTVLGPEVEPLGRVLAGSEDTVPRTDGALGERLVGTYLHGPVLPRNTVLADRLLSWVLGPLGPLDDDVEERLRVERLRAGRARGARRWLSDRLLARG